MTSVIQPGVTVLICLLANLNYLTGAYDLQFTGVRFYEANLGGTLLLAYGEIDVFSIPPNSFRRVAFTSLNLTWDNTKPLQLESVEELELVFCELNPNSITFSNSLESLCMVAVKFINGTLGDLLKSATHLQSFKLIVFFEPDLIWNESIPPLHMESLKELELAHCVFNPNSFTFSDSLTSLTLKRILITNGSLSNMFETITNLNHLEMRQLGVVDLSELLLPPFQTFQKIDSLTLVDTELRNGTLAVVLNKATRLQTLILENCGEVDMSKLNLNLSFLENLTNFTISKTKLMDGTIYDLLNNARKLVSLEIKHMDELDISNWHYNKTDNSSLQFLSLPEHCKLFYIENTKLTNGSVKDLLRNSRSLQNLTLDGTKLIGTTLYDILKTANKIQHFYFGEIGVIELSELLNLQIWKTLQTLRIGKTNFVNGNIDDLLRKTTNLETLIIDNMGKVDISKIYGVKLKYLHLSKVTLTRSRPSELLQFPNLQTLNILESAAEDSRTLFYNLNQMFPNIDYIDTGSQLIVHPKTLLSFLNSTATTLNFSFDFDPPVKTYEFGKAMKKLTAAGYIHGEYTDSINTILNKGVSSLQRVHLISLKRFGFAHWEWRVFHDHTSYGVYSGTTNDIKPVETKAVIYSYFLLLLVFIGIGTTGNTLSGIAIFKTKMENSAGVILFALTFFDTGVILTYLGSAYFNAELFYRMFLTTGSKSTEYTVDEHLWLNEQHSVLAYFIYPLNKTVYTTSVYTTLLISLERFVAVCFPLKAKYLLSRRNSIRAIVAIIIFSVLLNFPRWIESYEWNTYSEDSASWNEYYKPTLMRKQIYRTIYHGWVWVTFMYILPFILVAFFYFNIFRQTRRSNQLRRTLQSLTHEEETQDCTVMSSLTKMLLCVVAVFVVCNSVHIGIVFYFLASYEQVQLSTTEAVSCLPIVINCSVNFVIYVIMGKTLRAQFLILLPNCARRFLTCCRRDTTTNS